MYRIPTMHNFTPTFSKVDNGKSRSRQQQQEHPHITDNDLQFTSGKESQLPEQIDDRLNKNQGEVLSNISNDQIE